MNLEDLIPNIPSKVNQKIAVHSKYVQRPTVILKEKTPMYEQTEDGQWLQVTKPSFMAVFLAVADNTVTLIPAEDAKTMLASFCTDVSNNLKSCYKSYGYSRKRKFTQQQVEAALQADSFDHDQPYFETMLDYLGRLTKRNIVVLDVPNLTKHYIPIHTHDPLLVICKTQAAGIQFKEIPQPCDDVTEIETIAKQLVSVPQNQKDLKAYHKFITGKK